MTIKELISYETRHGVMWLCGEDQETWLGYYGPGCKCEGQVRGFGAMDHRWLRRASEVAVDETIRPHNDMKWIISLKKDQAKC
jgi:hypothetical protein